MMNEVIVDEVSELNANDKLNEDDLIDEVVHDTEGNDGLAVDVNVVIERDVDEVIDVGLDALVKKDVVVFLNADVELLFEIDAARWEKVDALEDVVHKNLDRDDIDSPEDDAEEDEGHFLDVTDESVCTDVVVFLPEDGVVEVDEADVLIDAAQVPALIAIVDVVADICELLMINAAVHRVNVDVLDGVIYRLPPMSEMMATEVGVNNIDNDVSPLDAMRPVGSIPRWTRMCDDQCFPLMQQWEDDIDEIVVEDGLDDG